MYTNHYSDKLNWISLKHWELWKVQSIIPSINNYCVLIVRQTFRNVRYNNRYFYFAKPKATLKLKASHLPGLYICSSRFLSWVSDIWCLLLQSCCCNQQPQQYRNLPHSLISLSLSKQRSTLSSASSSNLYSNYSKKVKLNPCQYPFVYSQGGEQVYIKKNMLLIWML